MHRKLSILGWLSGALVLSLCLTFLLGGHKALADENSDSAPTQMTTAAEEACISNMETHGGTYNEAGETWLSPPNQPNVLLKTIPATPGETVELQYNVGSYFCNGVGGDNGGSDLLESHFRVVSSTASAGDGSALKGSDLYLNIDSNPDDPWSTESITFGYVVPSTIPSGGNIALTVVSRTINYFGNPTVDQGPYQCGNATALSEAPNNAPLSWYTANGYHRSGISDFGPDSNGFCGTRSITLTFTITGGSTTCPLGQALTGSPPTCQGCPSGETGTPPNCVKTPPPPSNQSAPCPLLSNSSDGGSGSDCQIGCPSWATGAGCSGFTPPSGSLGDCNGFSFNPTKPLAYGGSNDDASPPTTSAPLANAGTPATMIHDDPAGVRLNSGNGIEDNSPGTQDQNPSHKPTAVQSDTYEGGADTVTINPQTVNGKSVNVGTLKQGSLSTNSGSAAQTTIDYGNYFETYPYDINQAQINYTSYYETVTWTALFNGNSCDSGGTFTLGYNATTQNNGATCYYTYAASNDTSCTVGYLPSPGSTYCVNNVSYNSGSYNTTTGVSNCPSGGSGYYGSCSYTTYPASTFEYAYCPTANGPNAYAVPTDRNQPNTPCTVTYTATAHFIWSASMPSQPIAGSSSSVDGPPMPECFNRTFTLTPSVGNTSINDLEDPTSATFSGSVQALFDESTDGPGGKNLRVGTSVQGIQTVGTVEVWHQNNAGNVTEESYPPSGDTFNGPSSYGPGDFNPSSTTSTSVGGSISVSLPPLQYGDEVCFSLSVNPSEGEVSDNSPWGVVNTINGKVTASPNPLQPGGGGAGCSLYTHAEPYLKVFGGDVAAGTSAAPSNSCSDPSAPIAAYNVGSGLYPGSGTELAAFAASTIDGFASAQNTGGSGPGPPGGLEFANPSGNSNNYGGNFTADQSDCATDYYTQGVTSATPESSPQAAINTALASGPGDYAYSVPGGAISSATIPNGYNIALYVTSGSVSINSNITLGVSTELSQMPNFELITNGGDIDIANTVTQLDGDYVAEGGTIDDCAGISQADWFYDTTGSGDPLSATCGYKLTVDGSFTAADLDLYRTAYNSAGATSTLHLATSGETPGSNDAAEEFDYSPATWLTYPNQDNGPNIQAITSLPPIL